MESALFPMGRLSNRVASYAEYGGTTCNWGQEAETVAGMSYDDWFRDKVAFGTPEAVTEKLRGLAEELGLDQIMFEVNWTSSVPREVVMKTMQILTDKVIPEFK
jgi:alkanesulfonate monooxygenase SsuD/methylene tetrahydromethanopterin reductase-like flavin-dependent oxidoreductase (luciferase family)